MIKQSARGRRLPTVVWEKDWKRLIRAGKDAQERCILAILLYGGLRLHELTSLNVPNLQLDRKDPKVHVEHGKGDKERLVDLSERAIPYVRAWLEERPAITEPDGAGAACADGKVRPVFVSTHRRRISDRQVERLVTAAAERIKLPTRITPHSLRHSAGTRLAEVTGDLQMVADHLGHESVDTARIYIHLSDQRRRKAVDKM